tara:strand:+ start:103 stop:525 length:423 start_codon:yes stop_codon:yes gene_type:complete
MANWLGFDYGKRFIGVAVGSDLTHLAEAVKSLPATKGVPHWDAIDQVVKTWQPVGLILGYPLNMDGSGQKMSRHVLTFRKNLVSRYQMPCYLVDERLSTQSAKEMVGNRHSKEQLNALAAQIILQHWFDEGMSKENHFLE